LTSRGRHRWHSSVKSYSILDIHSSVGHEDAAGLKAALIGGKEKNLSRDFLGPAMAAQWNNTVEKFGAILPDDLGEAFLDLRLKRVVDGTWR
jgi:hypothetical protein